MDTSLSKALIMVAGILLAMIIIGFATYTFRHLSAWSTTQEDEYATQEAQKFNKEYEAYQKDLMYGVDVISCLNKAKSNNDKVDKNIYDSEYLVTVNVKFKNDSKLEENFEIYYLPSSAEKKEKRVVGTPGDFAKKSTKLKKADKDDINGVFNIPQKYIDNIGTYSKMTNYSSYDFKPFNGEVDIEGTHTLATGSGTSPLFKALLAVSDNIRQVEKNKQYNVDTNNWTKAVWETPVYSMKKKKFKCTGISYNSKTGRVNEINFEEF